MGILGFVNKGSIISLIAGVAAAMFILGSLAWAKTNPRSGRITSLVVAFLLLGRFAPKAFQNQLYPAGIMFAASFVVIICLGAGHMIGMKERKAREQSENAN